MKVAKSKPKPFNVKTKKPTLTQEEIETKERLEQTDKALDFAQKMSVWMWKQKEAKDPFIIAECLANVLCDHMTMMNKHMEVKMKEGQKDLTEWIHNLYEIYDELNNEERK